MSSVINGLVFVVLQRPALQALAISISIDSTKIIVTRAQLESQDITIIVPVRTFTRMTGDGDSDGGGNFGV